MADECGIFEAGCKFKEWVGDAAGSAVAEVAQDWGEAAIGVIKVANSMWVDAPDPDTGAFPIRIIHQDTRWYIAAFAILGFLFALGKMVMSNDVKSLIGGVAPIVKLIIVTAAYGAGVAMLLESGNQFSSWIMERASGENGDLVGFGQLLKTAIIEMHQPGTVLLLALLIFIGAIVNLVFMFFRNVVIVIMLAIMPLLAASSGTEGGAQAFKKANGWLLAFILYKPVAAIIYAVGLWYLDDKSFTGSGGGDPFGKILTGVLILVLAALVLPALVKFIVPVAATGSGAFSGGAAVGAMATVAAGAAVIAATGGAGAGAGAGAAGAGSGTAGGAGGAGGATGGAGGTAEGAGTAGGESSSASGASGAKTSGNSSGEGSESSSGGSDSSSSGSDSAAEGAESSSDESSSSSGSAPAPAAGGAESGGSGDLMDRVSTAVNIAGAVGDASPSGSEPFDEGN